jgi:hypothetical protein
VVLPDSRLGWTEVVHVEHALKVRRDNVFTERTTAVMQLVRTVLVAFGTSQYEVSQITDTTHGLRDDVVLGCHVKTCWSERSTAVLFSKHGFFATVMTVLTVA